jgi:alkanesulfonate monooxygenase SsuD/methylene tetrahydromethanopterin reductase-like flavin-dependent oxidoreductase (luciferase family)
LIKLGLNIPNYGPTGTPREMRGWMRVARDGGFALAMMSDHVASTPAVEELYPSPFYDPFTTLAWLAADAGDLELGTSVTILPYRHPLLIARLAGTVDRLAGGRFVLGVGSGWAPDEFAALGVPFAERGRISDEYLEVITGVWPGRIWVGGTAPAALRRCARFGEAWHPNNADLAWMRDKGLPAVPGKAFCPRTRIWLADHDLPPTRRFGEGSLAQITADVRSLGALGAEYVVLDTNPDHPEDRLASETDWRAVTAVAASVLSGD